MSLSFQHVSFGYDQATSRLFEDVTVHLERGWTGIIGANGTGKTTFMKLAAGLLQPQQGRIKRIGQLVFCEQRTDDAPEQLPSFLASLEADVCVLRGKLQIGEDWAERWPTLSHGERKRAQIAVALGLYPNILLLDEPTNHLDIPARELLVDALRAFNGLGLLVSHDRDLLDLLCRQCLFLDPPHATIRSGNYSQAAAEREREDMSIAAEREALGQQLERLRGESQRRQVKASSADKRRSKRHLAKGDRDGRAKIDAARVSGKDGKAGRLAAQLTGRVGQLQDQISTIKIKKQYKTHFWLEGSVSPRRRLLYLPADIVPLDGSRTLHVPDFALLRDDRIAITGANGLGKSTLIRYILQRIDLPEQRIVYLPQEIDLAQTRNIMEEVRLLSRDRLGTVMTVVSALGSRPERLLHNLDATPGELRKVLLALGVIRNPYLIVMDEPTNHLDLPAIECLESALSDCPCALLLISHDLRFLSKVTERRWHLQQDGNRITISQQ